MKEKHQKISQVFQKWLLLVVCVAFLVTTAFLWFFQTNLSQRNAINLLALNIADVTADIHDASDENLLVITRQIARQLNGADQITPELLKQLARQFSVAEINYVDRKGVIRASTYPDFIDYDMASGEQSAAFLVLLDGQREFVQSYGPVSFDESIFRKYAAVTLDNRGFVQVGYDAQQFQSDISHHVKGATHNRHVGENGSIIIADEKRWIVSDRKGNEDTNLGITGLQIDTQTMPANQGFSAVVYGEPCYCMYQVAEGFLIIAVIPKSEAALSRNVSVGVTTVMQILVFAALFVLIYVLVKRLVVDNIHRVNRALSRITDGELETVVDVRSHEEFASLSDDINTTVDTLKRYIADAAARIDAELEFARAIQHSALPSVFPPYPGRREFDLFASMHTAKEVGGDFYDFYFVDKDTLAFVIADVSGKGIPAAMFMMTAKTLLKSCAESGMSVNEVFIRANEKLCEGNDAGMFVTAWMGFLDTATGCVSFANAGHNPPLVKHADGSFTYLKSKAGFVLAGMEGMRYARQELQLAPGDVLYLYTDGVTEATDCGETLYGEPRLQEVLNAHAKSDAQGICRAVKEDVDRFAGEAPQFDDITMLCLRYHGNGDTAEHKGI